MEFEQKIVITAEDYKSWSKNESLDNARIESAINYSYVVINAACNNKIQDLWGTDKITQTAKIKVEQAFLIETQYVLANNFDLQTGGSQSISLGGLSFNQSNSQYKQQLCDAAKELLVSAGLFYSAEFKRPANSSSTSLDDNVLEKYVTYDVADTRYIPTQQTDSTHFGKFPFINSQGIVEYRNGAGQPLYWHRVRVRFSAFGEIWSNGPVLWVLSRSSNKIETKEQLSNEFWWDFRTLIPAYTDGIFPVDIDYIGNMWILYADKIELIDGNIKRRSLTEDITESLEIESDQVKEV